MKEKLSNIWYHYKTYIIVFGLLLVSGLFLVVNFFSKVEPDLKVIVFTKAALYDADVEIIENQLEGKISDLNGDDKIEVTVKNIFYGNSELLETSLEEQLTVEMYYGEATLILCEQEGARQLLSYGASVIDISNRLTPTIYDGRGFMINTKSLLGDDLYFISRDFVVFLRNYTNQSEKVLDEAYKLIETLPPYTE